MRCPDEIRPATDADAEPFAQLFTRCLRDAYGGAMPASFVDVVSLAERAAKFRSAPREQQRSWLVATTAGGRLIGCAGFSPRRDDDLSAACAELTLLAVEKEHRRHGHGQRLLSAVCAAASARGWRVLVLWVVAQNAEARAFYERNGFRADATRRLDERLGFAAEVCRYRLELPPVRD